MSPRSKHHSREASLDISFENTVQNKSPQACPLPSYTPCDLSSFMDYLYYVERRAENLQFFLWFCDYVERWSRLPPHQRQAAPVWGPAQAAAAAHDEASSVSSSTPCLQPPPPTYNSTGPGPGAQQMRHGRGPSASSGYRHHRSYSHTYSSHARTFSTETVPYRPRSSSMTSVASAATAASVSSLAMSASAHTSLSRTSKTSYRPSYVSIHQRADNDRLANILTLLESLPEAAEHAPRHSLLSPRAPPDWCLHYQQALLSEHEHAQPLRAEMDRIVALYIDADGARALSDVDLLAPERAACLRAANHTTHPSALLPAFLAADAALRERLFPAFVKRWCVGNSGPWCSPRLVVAQAASVLLLLLGATVLVLLVRYEHSNAPRLVCLLLWWPALALLVLTRHRIDLRLYLGAQRLLGPWEADDDDALAVRSHDLDRDLEKSVLLRGHHHQAVSTSSVVSASSRTDALRKAALQAFGPRNDPDSEAWMVRQKQVSLYRRLLSQLSPSGQRTATIQHEGVRAMQKRAVWTAVMSAGLASAVFVLASLFVPVT